MWMHYNKSMADAKLHVIEAIWEKHNTVDGNSYNKFMVDAKLQVIEATYKNDITDCGELL